MGIIVSPNYTLLTIMPINIRTIVLLAAFFLAAACTTENGIETVISNDNESMLRRVIMHDGVEREYFVHVPNDAGTQLPVVVAIHGYTSTATGFEVAHSLNPHADANSYIVVYPQGSHFVVDGDTPYRVTSWNDLAANMPPKPEGPHCVEGAYEYPCPPDCETCNRCAWTSCADDLGFIEKMLNAVQAEFNADTERTYVLGVSNGGMMALRVACDLSDRFAAVAPIIAQLAPGYACGPSTDLPMMHLFGDEDDTVRADGLPGGDGFVYTSAEKTAATWAEALACDAGASQWENNFSIAAGLECTAYTSCRVDGNEVVSCMKPGGRHDWPGQRIESIPPTCVTAEQHESMPGQPRCAASDAGPVHAGMDLVWDFFSRYPAPH